MPGVFLRHDQCASYNHHVTSLLLPTLSTHDGGTLSPPSHIGYRPGYWFFSVNPWPHQCYSFAITVFEENTESHLVDGFRVGQKLEAVDFLGHHCVATVNKTDAKFNRIFIHFDGWESGDWDFWTTPDSELIAPIGTTESMEMPLDPPKGYLRGGKENFVWHTYLEETMSEPVPTSAFVQTSFFDTDSGA
eukprot:CAMPEP_0170174786 /NCGR_PEP_ID=MMETSP0040_2-20121228/7987_1 /TAXON_ID=641309 /ORGANISM="Lotharella oceanica, Strain CCMP622" /LENGTH=189 /DNA_ID=CAMNT_0010416571 /DNA_START=111 /DNA_END=680 /DNA_ORIENTATION=-